MLETIRFDVPFDCIVSFVGEVNVMASSLLTAQSAFLPDLGKQCYFNFLSTAKLDLCESPLELTSEKN